MADPEATPDWFYQVDGPVDWRTLEVEIPEAYSQAEDIPPEYSFTDSEGYHWKTVCRSFIPGYDEVVRQDGVRGIRRSDWIAIAALRCTGSIQKHTGILPEVMTQPERREG